MGAIRSLRLFSYPLENMWHDVLDTGVTQPFVVLSASVDTSVGLWDVADCLRIRVSTKDTDKQRMRERETFLAKEGVSQKPQVSEFDFEGGEGELSSYMRLMGVVHETMSVNAAVMEWASRGHGDGRQGVPPGHADTARHEGQRTWLRLFTACGTGTWDRVVKVFTGPVHGQKCRQSGTLRGHEDHVHSLEIVPSRELLVSASADRTIRVWSTVVLTAVCYIIFDVWCYIISSCVPYDGWYCAFAGPLQVGCLHPSIDVICMTFGFDELFTSSEAGQGVDVWDVETMEHKAAVAVTKDRRHVGRSVTSLCASGGILYGGLECGTVHEVFI